MNHSSDNFTLRTYICLMLHRLSIRNYAIIDKLEIEFCENMNVITGETGAGKSILVGALGLILGERADTKVLYNKEEKCVVEADFYIGQYQLNAFFAENELDYEAHTIIRREINQSGKSRAFINDTPVTLDILTRLSEQLVNLHTQHETLDLVQSGFQLSVIDALAKNQSLLSTYRSLFTEYKRNAKNLQELEDKQRTASAELDYLRFQWRELSEAKLEEQEQEKLEAEQGTLSNVEEIKRSVQNALEIVSNNEGSVLDQLAEVQSQLKATRNFSKEIFALTERLQSSALELKDIVHDFEMMQDKITLDPEKLEEINARLSTIYHLLKKHNVTTTGELLRIQGDLEGRIALVDTGSQEIEKMRALIKGQLKELTEMAERLHRAREKVLREFQNGVVVLLTKVGMPGASFKVDIEHLKPEQLNENGLTNLRFLFSANKGFAPREIREVASGGELSRLMLCIKSLVAGTGGMPTLIFDEIDAGISGEVAHKVGEIMKKLSRNHQLIAITHLPQIARTGDLHLYVYKEDIGGRTRTGIKRLAGEERVIEIAKMLSGDQPTDTSIANARELIAG